ncbi:acyltransferase domain-containing protein [Streptomyces sp. NPDC050704]|uniref:acyltransferase domain-containing protein n=1 Tax=Streptomyces sp. NPDC050704 TaxID=3157219 RepID=UPI0034335A19
MSESAGDRPRRVALLLPGQGAQYRRMGAGLYASEPVFTGAMDEVFSAMGRAGPALRADWLAERPSVPVDSAAWAQPLLFAVDYALGRLVMSWGVRPAALLGHSVGEMAAAVLAGVFRLRDATGLVLDRVSRVATAPPGGMIAVAAAPAEVEPFLTGDVVIGAVNAPRHTVLAGPGGLLAETARKLDAQGLTSRPVPSHTAFHSPVLAPCLAGAGERVAATARRPPLITVYSGYTAAPLRSVEALDPDFWARQPMAPVLFWPALDALLSSGEHLLVEAGPGRGLGGIARRHPAVRRGASSVVTLLPARPGDDEQDRLALRAAAEALRVEGFPKAVAS